MELLARTLRSFRYVVGGNGWFTFLAAVAFISLEVIGRQTSTDWHDVLVASALAALVVFIILQHTRSPLPWLLPISRGLRAAGLWTRQWLFEIGYDLRGEPPVRRGMPPMVFGIAAVFFGWGAVLLIFGDYFPHVLRAGGVQFFYLGYLAVMAVVWLILIAMIGIAFYFAVGLIHDELMADSDGRRPRGPSRAALWLGLVAALLLGSRFLALAEVLGLCLLAWLVLSIVIATGGPGDVRFLWRPRGSVRVRSVSAAQCSLVFFGLGTVLALDLAVTTAGSQVWPNPAVSASRMPLTTTLGSILGWVLLAALWVFVWQAAKERMRSPSRSSRRSLHVRGSLTMGQRRQLRRHFSWRKWRIDHDPNPVDSCAVQIELVAPNHSQAREFDPSWPLKMCLDDLDDPSVRDRLERRSDIQVRRRIIGGLERLFKIALRRKYRNGHGFWVAPHLALWNGLRRDEPEPEPGPFDTHMVADNIGPAYHRVFPHLARHTAHRMLRGMQIDLIFVEDGVSFRRFAKVMRRIFELHDRHGNKPAQDQHFVGLTGTRAIVYEFQFDNPFESEVYPEPKFTTLGRARILLVFRDRSEQEELIEPPFDSSRSPAPMGFSG